MQHTFFVHFFAVVLHDCNVKRPSLRSARRISSLLETSWFTFYGGSVVGVLVHFFFHCRSFSPARQHPAATKFHVVPPTKMSPFVFCLSLSAPFLVELRSVALLSLFLCLSFSLYSKFVDMTINLSLILKTTWKQKHFPLSVFVFIDCFHSCLCFTRRR